MKKVDHFPPNLSPNLIGHRYLLFPHYCCPICKVTVWRDGHADHHNFCPNRNDGSDYLMRGLHYE